MREPTRLDWRVPEDEWQHFREYVREKFGGLDGYLGREAEAAMREWTDSDGYGGVEERINRLVKAAGRTPAQASKEKNSESGRALSTESETPISRLREQPTERVTVRVDEDVKDEFRAAVDDQDVSYGVMFARAIQVRRDGGRAARLERKLDRVIDDAEQLLGELDTGESGGMSAKQKKIVTICSRLGDRFMDSELNGEIHDVAGRADQASDPTLESYREAVLDRLDVEPHPVREANPNKPGTLWIPSAEAEDLTPEGVPEETRRPVAQLERDERADRIKYVLGRRAGNRSSGRVTARSPQIREEILDSEVTKQTTLSLMEEVALTHGYEIDRSNGDAALKVNLKTIGEADEELFHEILAYRDADADSLLAETTEATVSDYTQPTVDDVSSQMDSITQASTDGGGAPTHGRGDDDD